MEWSRHHSVLRASCILSSKPQATLVPAPFFSPTTFESGKVAQKMEYGKARRKNGCVTGRVRANELVTSAWPRTHGGDG